MLNETRALAGGFTGKLLLGLLILSFALWGIGDMVRGPGPTSTLVEVGSHTITILDYQRALQREMENIRRSLGDKYSPEMLKNFNVPQIVLNRMINQELLALDTKDQGIIPADGDVAKRIRANPMLADESGKFSKERFSQVLRGMGKTEKAYVDDMRSELAGNLLMDAIGGSAHVPEKEIESVYQAFEEQRTATLYTLRADAIPDVPAPDAAALETFYNEHAQRYTTPEYRTLAYVTVPQEFIRGRAKVTEEELKRAYEERAEEFRQGERRKVDQLIFPDEAKAQKALELIKGGKTFAEVARQSDIQNKNAISMGALERGGIFESAEESVFSLPEGGITDVISSPFGFHIFHVAKILPASTQPFAEVKARLEKELLQTRFEDELTHFTNSLQDMLAGGSSLQETAKSFGLSVKTTEAVTAEGKNGDGQASKTLPALDQFLDVAFKTDEKTESSLIASKGGQYYVLRTESITPERVRPLADIKAKVAADWQKQERQDKLAALAKTLEKEFADEKTRAAAIAKYDLQSSAIGPIKQGSAKTDKTSLPPGLVEELFMKKPHTSTSAYAISADSYGIAVVSAIVPTAKKITADKNSVEFVQIKKTLQQQQADELIDQYMRYLAKRYHVSIDEKALEAILKNADR